MPQRRLRARLRVGRSSSLAAQRWRAPYLAEGREPGNITGMCTVTWFRGSDAYELFCNRDERHERAEAEPPTVREREGGRIIAPTDPDGGGTWISVNEHGLTLCLLNGYRASDDLVPAPHFTSRGQLVEQLADAASADAALGKLTNRDLTSFRSFDLLVMGPDAPPRLASWNRAARALRNAPARVPLISCPLRTHEVLQARTDVLLRLVSENGGVDTDVLQAFHESRHPDGWIWSVAMSHDVAATRSLSHVSVTPDEVAFAYTPGRPGDVPALPAVTVPRLR